MAVLNRTARAKTGLVHWWESGRWVETLIIVILAIASMIMFYPFLWLVFSSFKTGTDIVTLPVHLLPRQWTLSAYTMVWTRTNLPRAYANSLGVSAAIVVTVLFTSSLGASSLRASIFRVASSSSISSWRRAWCRS